MGLQKWAFLVDNKISVGNFCELNVENTFISSFKLCLKRFSIPFYFICQHTQIITIDILYFRLDYVTCENVTVSNSRLDPNAAV